MAIRSRHSFWAASSCVGRDRVDIHTALSEVLGILEEKEKA